MAFNWNHFIVLAEQLNVPPPDDSKMRSAISRAYYGAFIQCRTKKGLQANSKHDIHQVVINAFKTSQIPMEVTIGNLLYDLKKERSESDYNGFYVPTPQNTRANILKAKSIVTALAKL